MHCDLDSLVAAVARSAATAARGSATAAQPMGQGAGDVSYAVDLACEAALDGWFEAEACQHPLSLLTEHHGWRHRGPDGAGGTQELPGFDHGGPRVVCDPVDGTRHLLADHRSAWVLAAACGAGKGTPRLAEVRDARALELPPTWGGAARCLGAARGQGAWIQRASTREPLQADGDDRLDHGFFTFFAFTAEERVPVAELGRKVVRAWVEELGADAQAIWQDDYVSSGGLLLQAALGSQRLVVDPRGLLGELRGGPTSAHGYDLAAPVLILREAGGSVTDASGRDLDLDLDAHSPIAWVAWCNAATRARGEQAVLRAIRRD